MKFDTSRKGLRTLFRPQKVALLEHIWDLNKDVKTGITSIQALDFLWQTGDRNLMKSRATVILVLNEPVEEEVLSYEEKTKKGGHYKVYFPKMNREEFANHVIKTITRKLRGTFPSVMKL